MVPARPPAWVRMLPSTWWILAFKAAWTTSRVAVVLRHVPLQGGPREARLLASLPAVTPVSTTRCCQHWACQTLLSDSCRWNAIASNSQASDCFGHGSALASIAAGAVYGVAKSARIVGVRVLDCSGQGGPVHQIPLRCGTAHSRQPAALHICQTASSLYLAHKVFAACRQCEQLLGGPGLGCGPPAEAGCRASEPWPD